MRRARTPSFIVATGFGTLLALAVGGLFGAIVMLLAAESTRRQPMHILWRATVALMVGAALTTVAFGRPAIVATDYASRRSIASAAALASMLILSVIIAMTVAQERERDTKRSRPRSWWTNHRFERDSAMVLAGTMAANASTYVFHVIVSRHLGPEAYGALGAVLGLAILPAVPSAGLQFAVARRVAAGSTDYAIAATSGTLRIALRTAAIGFALTAAAAWPLSQFLRTSPFAIGWLAVWLIPIFAGPVLLGALQGRRQFAMLAVSAAVLGLGRIVGAVVVSVADGGVAAAVLVMALAAAASVVVAWVVVRPLVSLRGTPAPKGMLREISRTTGPFLGLAAVAGLDAVLARRFLPADQAGFYVAASVAGKIVFWAPASISVVAFPDFAGTPRSDHLRRALVAVAAVCGAAVVGLLVLREQVIGGLFGAEFLPAADVVFVVAVAMAGLAIVQVLATWAIAHRLRGIGSTLLAGAGLLALLIAGAHASPRAIAFDVLATSAVVTLVMALRVRRAQSREQRLVPA